jgi:glycosyltransferase involved in cell wall biosynthesis
MYKLTIAIPTFNRNEILLGTVKALIPQLRSDVELLIIDNNSDTPCCDTLTDVICEHDGQNIRVLRNRVNVGGNANILKCTEEAFGEYVWVLGDDDLPKDNAVGIIIELLVNNPDVLWLNFKSEDPVNQPLRHASTNHPSLVTFLASLESINELVFISNNVVKVDLIKPAVYFGYLHLGKHFPIGVAMIKGISASNLAGSYLIENTDLFGSTSLAVEERAICNWLMYVGIMRLVQVQYPQDVSAAINKLLRGSRKGWVSNRALMAGIASHVDINGRKRTMIESYDALGSIIILDKFKAIYTFPLLLIAYLLGGKYFKVTAKIKSIWGLIK